MKILIVKRGATGDVVRTTTLLRLLEGDITWLTERKNAILLRDLQRPLRCVEWEERECARKSRYDLVVNLEDTLDVAEFIAQLHCERVWGACLGPKSEMSYSDDARAWFDLSIISRFGKKRADELKLANRATYQQLIFEGLGARFNGQLYALPDTEPSPLQGDIALATEAGPVWPMKKWAYFAELRVELKAMGFVVNELPPRATLFEHLADVRNHRCLVSGDSLPMHFALGSGTPCVTLFTCTSPWEIHEYGLQHKIVSPLLNEFFYKRGWEERATTAISVDEVMEAVLEKLRTAKSRTGVA